MVCTPPEAITSNPLTYASTRVEEIFNPLWCFVAAVGEEAMVSHPDPEHPGGEIQNDGGCNRAPVDEEERRHCEHVKRSHCDGRDRVHALLVLAAVHQRRCNHRTNVPSMGEISEKGLGDDISPRRDAL